MNDESGKLSIILKETSSHDRNSTIPQNSWLMNFTTWNCQGIGMKGFVNLICDISLKFSISLMFLLETCAYINKAKRIAHRTGFDDIFLQESIGQSDEIWCLWKSYCWIVKVLKVGQQFIYLMWSGRTIIVGSSQLSMLVHSTKPENPCGKMFMILLMTLRSHGLW